jgi:hypothetical protein
LRFGQEAREHGNLSRSGMSFGVVFGKERGMLDGNMAVGDVGDALVARVGPARHADERPLPSVRPMDFVGKPMKGYVYVDPPGVEVDAALENRIGVCADFVTSLPPQQF